MAKKKNKFPPKADQPRAEKYKGELEKDLTKLREDLRALRFKSEGARSKNVKEVLNVRRQIARLLTEINAR